MYLIKKLFYLIISIVFVLYFGGCMFYCFICSAPVDNDSFLRYVFYTAMFSIIMPGFLCGCLHYIHYLHKLIEEMKKA